MRFPILLKVFVHEVQENSPPDCLALSISLISLSSKEWTSLKCLFMLKFLEKVAEHKLHFPFSFIALFSRFIIYTKRQNTDWHTEHSSGRKMMRRSANERFGSDGGGSHRLFRGPILEFARGSFPPTFPRLSNETPPTAYSKSHRHLTASHRSRFLERKVWVVFTVRHSNLVYEIAGIKLLWQIESREK